MCIFCQDQQYADLPWENVRLPVEIVPTLYHLWLYPDLNKGIFTGRVTITVNVLDSQRRHVAVHTKGLTIKSAKVVAANDDPCTEITLRQSFEYKPNEFWVMVPKETLEAGHYKLYFEFEGQLLNKIVGFYRSAYTDINGKQRFIATSKFEPTFARQAFPCFDEPGMKAKFNIEMVKPADDEFIALSNMDQLEQISNIPHSGLVTVKFSTTKPMSTYLACFILCDFDVVKGDITTGGFPVNVFARRNQIKNAHLAKNVAVNATNFYLSYFNIVYPLPKLDLIAIPDFVSGAMENWGLITFRETRLLCDPINSPVAAELDVAITIAHEIAHMWFGDLVTMAWWNDLWLNEGFATFIAYKAVAHIYPDWHLDELFLLAELFSVLNSDSSLSSHPIIMPVDYPDQITEIFDSISYNKSASVIRMLEHTIGPEAFRNGIHNYLQEFQFKNAKTEDLWSHLNQAAKNVDVGLFMETWTLQMGYPVINVKVHCDERMIEFSQKRFLIDSDATYESDSSPFGYLWEVPITFLSSLHPRTIRTSWIRKNEHSITVPFEEQEKPDGSKLTWIKVNFHHFGYYIVNYELPLWETLQNLLKQNPQILDPADRASLIFDAFTLAEAKQLPYEYALDFIDCMRNERHYTPWAIASKRIHDLLRKLYGSDGYDLFKNYVRTLVDDTHIINWEIDDRASFLQKSLQATIIELGCAVGHPKCLNEAVALFKHWLSTPSVKLNPELASIILKYGIEETTEIEWKHLWSIYLNEENPQEKKKFMNALCFTKDTSIVSTYLQTGKNESIVRSQDYLFLIIIISQNPTASPIVWDFIRNEWEYLISRYTLNDRNLGRVIPGVSSSFSTEIRLSQMKEFFQKYPEAGAGQRGREVAVERVVNNIKWHTRNLVPTTQWLKKMLQKSRDELSAPQTLLI